MTTTVVNPQLELAHDFIQYTNRNIFLTGKAGTGKTTFLRTIKQQSPKRMIVVAPTGVAAMNAGGVTIHSFFQLPFGPYLSPRYTGADPNAGQRNFAHRFSAEKINIIKSIDLLVIDEISMVRADVLDGIDDVLRRYRMRHLPFGGVQLLMIGDVQQLAPVVKDDEWSLLKNVYDTMYFFSSKALREVKFESVELKHIYRQSDQRFVDLLNKVRENRLDEQGLADLNKHYDPVLANEAPEGYITLTTHVYQAQNINDSRLRTLEGPTYEFDADIEGDFPEYQYPTESKLVLKEGAQVMFVKNDISREKLYYNGKIGVVERVSKDAVCVRAEGESTSISVGIAEWANTRYTINEETKDIEEKVIGTFKQYPLKLAWAITIHKSQGLTFEKAIVDASASFAHGQVYVALSRCKSMEGLVLRSQIAVGSIKNDSTVAGFSREVECNPPDQKKLNESKIDYQVMLFKELLDFMPVLRRINFCQKLYHDNSQSLHKSFIEAIISMVNGVNTEMVEVSNKFMVWVQHTAKPGTCIEGNEAVQKRLIDACKYFHEKIEVLVNQPLVAIDVITDNKTVKKHVMEALEKIAEESFVKRDCLLECQKGFTVKQYLRTRSRSMLEKPQLKKQNMIPEKNPAKVMNTANISGQPQLFAELRKWKEKKAGELDVASNVILPYKSCIEIANRMPVTIEELKDISGIGKKTRQSFGSEIIRMVRKYCGDQGIEKEYDATLPLEAVEYEAEPKVKTQQLSYDMFASGKTVKEIAEERGLSPGTIEGHLALYVGNGTLEVQELISANRLKCILEAIEQTPDATPSQLRSVLGDDYSYGEIKIAQSHVEYVASTA